MPAVNQTKRDRVWQELHELSNTLVDERIANLVERQTEDYGQPCLHISHEGLRLDTSKQLINPAVTNTLGMLFTACNAQHRLQELVDGKAVNNTEQRPALHTAIRATICDQHAPHADWIRTQYHTTRDLGDSIYRGQYLGHSGKPISDVVNLGIGGSDLGPRMATAALADYQDGHTRVHYVSSLDSTELDTTLSALNPETTLFLVSSKSFSTEETLVNAQRAIAWFKTGSGNTELTGHFAAITGNVKAARELGIPASDIYPVPEWIGGRYSIWSSVGLPLMIAIGSERFEQMLAGAYRMDQHAQTANFHHNMPAMLAALEIWNSTILGYPSLAVIPYSYALRLFPAYLQQLVMESNGKRCTHDGKQSPRDTAPLVWGTAGTEGQHSYHQWLHQGTQGAPVDFILPLGPTGSEHHTRLASHCIAQSKVLMEGITTEAIQADLVQQGMPLEQATALAPHKAMPGNRPSNTLLMEQLNPANLGALIALYEHKTFFSSVMWDINAFDQWGVELGKQVSRQILTQLTEGHNQALDPSTDALIRYLRSRPN